MQNMKKNQVQRAVLLLQEKAAILGRLPKKEDFPPEDVARIKSALGPWPRALEEAKLKEAKPISTLEKNRIRRKKKETEKRRQKKHETNSSNS